MIKRVEKLSIWSRDLVIFKDPVIDTLKVARLITNVLATTQGSLTTA